MGLIEGWLHDGPRVLVCGSRTWRDAQAVDAALDILYVAWVDDLVVVHGGAPGADRLADKWAKRRGVAREPVLALWNDHHPKWCPGQWCHDSGKGCKGAGPRRNQEMLDNHRPDLVLAYSERPVTSGTGDMMRRARRAGVPVYLRGHVGNG